MLWFTEPQLIVMVAERTSWLSFGMVVMLICAFPARPLLGSILHYPIERVSITEAVHSLLAVNDIVAFPPADEKAGLRFSVPGTMIDGASFVLSSLHAIPTITNANSINIFFIALLELDIIYISIVIYKIENMIL